MDAIKSLGSGAIGAGVLTLIHQSARHAIPHAPRVDVIGRRGLAGTMRAAGLTPPAGQQLQNATLAAEVISNSLYYALVGIGSPRHVMRRGAILGLLAGLGAVGLPPIMGLGRQPVRRTPQTALMTVGWYLAGGLAAAVAAELFSKQK